MEFLLTLLKWRPTLLIVILQIIINKDISDKTNFLKKG